jgi:DNA mismatch repair protein MutH
LEIRDSKGKTVEDQKTSSPSGFYRPKKVGRYTWSVSFSAFGQKVASKPRGFSVSKSFAMKILIEI